MRVGRREAAEGMPVERGHVRPAAPVAKGQDADAQVALQHEVGTRRSLGALHALDHPTPFVCAMMN
jgi:hypothetical protein